MEKCTSTAPEFTYEAVRTRVLLHVDAEDASFDIMLSRVPSIGEDINLEDRCYRVTRVQHESVDMEGRARFGWHAMINAELQPEETRLAGRTRMKELPSADVGRLVGGVRGRSRSERGRLCKRTMQVIRDLTGDQMRPKDA